MPGTIAAIQTQGDLLHWHPHIHVLISCGVFTPELDFQELPQFDMERLSVAYQQPDRGDVDQARLRGRPLILCSMWRPKGGSESPTGGTDVRGDGHVAGHLIMITDARRPGNVASELRSPPAFCGLTGCLFHLNSRFLRGRFRPVGGNQISYQ